MRTRYGFNVDVRPYPGRDTGEMAFFDGQMKIDANDVYSNPSKDYVVAWAWVNPMGDGDDLVVRAAELANADEIGEIVADAVENGMTRETPRWMVGVEMGGAA